MSSWVRYLGSFLSYLEKSGGGGRFAPPPPIGAWVNAFVLNSNTYVSEAVFKKDYWLIFPKHSGMFWKALVIILLFMDLLHMTFG